MNNLYSIISKQAFTSLFRFGQIPLRTNEIIENKEDSKELENMLFERLSSLAIFEGEEDYLIIGFEGQKETISCLNIKAVTEIIPLTTTARKSYQSKFDSRIDFKEARFQNVFSWYKKEIKKPIYSFPEYYYIVNKQELESLYRFQQIPLRFDEIISADTNNLEEKIKEQFGQLAAFDDDKQYIILRIPKVNQENARLSKGNVHEFIPLSKEAHISLSHKYGKYISFQEPRFEKLIHEVEQSIDIDDKLKGATSLWQILNIRTPFDKIIEDDIIKLAYAHRSNGQQSNQIKEDFYTHLLVYERYSFFPKTDLGYFYDIGEIFAHTKGYPTFKGSGLYKYLELSQRELMNAPLSKIIETIEDEPKIESFKSQLTKAQIRQYISGAFFLKFKEEIQEQDSIKGTQLAKIVSWYQTNEKDDVLTKEELNHAVYLTGVFFGYKKFYDDLYGVLDLAIFKESKSLDSGQGNLEREPQTIEVEPQKNTSLANENILEEANHSYPAGHTVDLDINPSSKTEANNLDLRTEILLQIKELFKNSPSGQIIIKNNMLKILKKIFLPFYKTKTINKDKVLETIKVEFRNELNLIKQSKDYRVELKKHQDLFSTTN